MPMTSSRLPAPCPMLTLRVRKSRTATATSTLKLPTQRAMLPAEPLLMKPPRKSISSTPKTSLSRFMLLTKTETRSPSMRWTATSPSLTRKATRFPLRTQTAISFTRQPANLKRFMTLFLQTQTASAFQPTKMCLRLSPTFSPRLLPFSEYFSPKTIL